jgi:hypothetical protein
MRIHKNYIAFVGFVLLFFLFSCKKEQEIPSYIYIPNVNVNGIYSISGTDSSNIYGVKVFLNNNLIGVYQTPTEVPVFAEGEQIIKTLALVEKNGLSEEIIRYPYYELSEDVVFLARDNTVELNPVVDYFPTTNTTYWFEDFDGQSMSFKNSENSTSELVITDQPELVYENNGSGLFELENASDYIKALTNENFIYSPNTNAFVELNYKNNQPFFFNIVIKLLDGQVQKIPRFQFRETIDENGNLFWNKIYLEIGSVLNEISQLKSFEICFEVGKDESVINSVVIIDNVKLIRDK